MRGLTRAVVVLVVLAAGTPTLVCAAPPGTLLRLDTVQDHFYNGRYTEAAALAQELPIHDGDLAVYEMRTTAILFQIRRAMGDAKDRGRAYKACAACPRLMADFTREFEAGRAAARAAVSERPDDADARFFLGKINLNWVWLYLGTLGRRTGWNEYWEARRSLDAALERAPMHQRARVARAWIDYIVDTRMPWGTEWMLGGGDRKRALAVMREVVEQRDDFYVHAEAMFGLWDMQVREKDHKAALTTAVRLLDLFPNNPEVAQFVSRTKPK
ncbi:MAG: tol-pal system YbgF family protein [Vicinamibacterales bacterium]